MRSSRRSKLAAAAVFVLMAFVVPIMLIGIRRFQMQEEIR